MNAIKTDLCILGAGAGGLSVAAGAVQMGARVVLIEAGQMGGDCLNHGCVPSKALIAAANAAHAARSAGRLGVHASPRIDMAEVRAHVRAAIAAIAPHDSQERFESLGVQVIRAFGRFVSPNEVEAGGQRIRARRFVLATGARPVIPPVPGLADVPFLTNETLFDLDGLPEHLLVLGGGAIGLEMAQAHARLGARVTVIEAGQIAAREDPEAVALLRDHLLAEGIVLHEQAPALSVRHADGTITVETAAGPVQGSHLLVAAGRRPAFEGLGLAAAGVRLSGGRPVLDHALRSTNRRIHVIGDAAGGAQFTHLAGYHAGLVLRPILFALPARRRDDHIPRVIYTEPELAQIGLTEAEARARHGARLEVQRAEFAANDRAITRATRSGFVKLMIHRGRPVGATLIGPEAGEQAGLWALVLANRLRMGAIAGTVLPYPTLNETGKRAAGGYFSARLFGNPRVRALIGLVRRLIR